MQDDPKTNNQSENQRANDAARDVGLTREEQRQMHDDPRMQDGLSYQDLRDIARDIKNNKGNTDDWDN